MEAARVAALRGHDVTLVEKAHDLGGLLPLASLVKGLEIEDLLAIIRYYKVQLRKLGVKVITGKEADAAYIKGLRPDAVVLAVGGKLQVPKIRGIEGKKVLTAPELHRRVKPWLRLLGPRFLGWLTKFWLPMGKKVVIIGGNLQGCEMAEFLVKRGRQVTILEESPRIGEGVVDFRLGLLLEWFRKKGVAVYTEAKVLEITDRGVSFEHRGQRMFLEADTVVPLAPMAPNLELLEELKGSVPEVHAVGDCREPALIVDAIHEAWSVARQI